jgi:hypothetical protein
MNRILFALLLSVLPISAQTNTLRDLGVIAHFTGLAWDYPTNQLANVRFRVYVADTNDLATVKQRLVSLGEVPGLRWPTSSNLTTSLNGPYAVAVTAVASLTVTNLSGTNVTVSTNTIESDFSEVVAVNFRDGVPLPPSNVQLFTALYFAATNSLPALPDLSAPILPAMMLAPGGSDYELSGR